MDLLENAVKNINKAFEDKGLEWRFSYSKTDSQWFDEKIVYGIFKKADGRYLQEEDWRDLRKDLDNLGLQNVYVNDRGDTALDNGETIFYISEKLADKSAEVSGVYAIPEFLNEYLAKNDSAYHLTLLRCCEGITAYQFIRKDGSIPTNKEDSRYLRADMEKLGLDCLPITLDSRQKDWTGLCRPSLDTKYVADAETYIKDKVTGVVDRKNGNTIFHLRDLLNEKAEITAYFFDRNGTLHFNHTDFNSDSLKKLGFSTSVERPYPDFSRLDEVCEAIKNGELKYSESYYARKFISLVPVKDVHYDYSNDKYFCFTMRAADKVAEQVMKSLTCCGVKVEKNTKTGINSRHSLYLPYNEADKVIAKMKKIDWNKESNQMQSGLCKTLNAKEYE